MNHTMIDIATHRSAGGPPERQATRAAWLRRQLSDDPHAGGNSFASQNGWAIGAPRGGSGSTLGPTADAQRTREPALEAEP